ncbi:hypothetical protein EJ05DRAFT_220862 [Pseudovirgaria hyperparasitica]|uniref:DUF7730 domain-containing protein n=1 Tax=Pseudovirgaria hyperparasitica TaxID=470096 RepID=A0A6A6VTP7_9PEZI|nr:uncharacterized protein EJ05DRAFT_220862 [Pseudovirgaria hyperparasitica]KAF2753525.1 hypothetical protein EJ05DRAFT_220862 [Pseudovirgaria hyperparasitica]
MQAKSKKASTSSKQLSDFGAKTLFCCLCWPIVIGVYCCNMRVICGTKPFNDFPPAPLPARRPRRLTNDKQRFRLQKHSRKDQSQAQFLTMLPLEIRRQVYREVIGNRRFYVVVEELRTQQSKGQGRIAAYETVTVVDTDPYLTTRFSHEATGLLNLLTTCWRIYVEAMPILYESNSFVIPTKFGHLRTFESTILPSRFTSIRRLELTICYNDLPRDAAARTQKGVLEQWRLLRSMASLRFLTLALSGFRADRQGPYDDLVSHVQQLVASGEHLRNLRRCVITWLCVDSINLTLKRALDKNPWIYRTRMAAESE